nr:glutamate dehydrogenase [Opitutaceae bacterium]
MKTPAQPGSSLYDSDVFRMACRQFDLAADLMGLDPDVRERTKLPKRCLTVTVPVKHDDGRVRV